MAITSISQLKKWFANGEYPTGERFAALLDSFYHKSEAYTKDELNAKLSAIPKFGYKVVSSLPTEGISGTTVYILPGTADPSVFTEHIYEDGAWYEIGRQQITLEEYAQKTEVPAIIDDLVTDDATKALSAAQGKVLMNLTNEYNVSAHNNGNSYTLSEAVVLIPENLRKGGMTIAFVDSASGKFVKYLCTEKIWSSDPAVWTTPDNRLTFFEEHLTKTEITSNNQLQSNYYIGQPLSFANDRPIWFGAGKTLGELLAMHGRVKLVLVDSSGGTSWSAYARLCDASGMDIGVGFAFNSWQGQGAFGQSFANARGIVIHSYAGSMNTIVGKMAVLSNVDNETVDLYSEQRAVIQTELADNLVTERPDMALSAKQGTILDRKISNMAAKLDSIDKNLASIRSVIFANDQAGLIAAELVGRATLSASSNGFRISRSESDAAGYVGVRIIASERFITGHDYFVAIRLKVSQNSLTEGATSAAGNNYFYVAPKVDNDSYSVGSQVRLTGAVTGTETIVRAKLSVTDMDSHIPAGVKPFVYVQFGNYALGQKIDVEVYEMMAVDLTKYGVTYEYVSDAVDQRGIVPELVQVNATHAEIADVAKSVEEMSVGGDIDIWGDSLTAQNWGKYLQELTGRKCYIHGFGGKKSTYIRDQYLNGLNRKRTQILFVGRNNYSETDTIINDLRTMVKAYGGYKFLVMTPPNGGYSSSLPEQGYAGEELSTFRSLEDRLCREYQSNYLNNREACIYGYDMGGVHLLSPFTQPSVGSHVTIEVSDTGFLTTYNTSDESKYGNSLMRKIRIGLNGKYDVYTVVSVIDGNRMIVSLDAANRIAVGNIVANLVDDGGTSSIIYLNVWQNCDYLCYINDTTQSTFRSDGIHMSIRGLQLLAEVVARKLETMKI